MNRHSDQNQGRETDLHARQPLRSKIRVAYLITYGIAIISAAIFLIVFLKNGEGQVAPELLPYLIGSFVGIFIGLFTTMFVVHCGKCSTRIFHLMRRAPSSRNLVQFEGDISVIFKFMVSKKCSVCECERI